MSFLAVQLARTYDKAGGCDAIYVTGGPRSETDTEDHKLSPRLPGVCSILPSGQAPPNLAIAWLGNNHDQSMQCGSKLVSQAQYHTQYLELAATDYVIVHKILYSNIIHGRCIHDDNLVRRFN
jgi:hypothetical protein